METRKVSVILPASLWKKATHEAVDRDETLQQYILEAITMRVEHRFSGDEILKLEDEE